MVTDYYCKSIRFSLCVSISLLSLSLSLSIYIYIRGVSVPYINNTLVVGWWLVVWWFVGYPTINSTHDFSIRPGWRSHFVSVVMVIINRQTDGRTLSRIVWRGDLSHICCVCDNFVATYVTSTSYVIDTLHHSFVRSLIDHTHLICVCLCLYRT